MSEQRLYTVMKGDNTFYVMFTGMSDDDGGYVSDGEFFVGPGEKFLDKIPFEQLKEGQYDENGKYLGLDYEG